MLKSSDNQTIEITTDVVELRIDTKVPRDILIVGTDERGKETQWRLIINKNRKMLLI